MGPLQRHPRHPHRPCQRHPRRLHLLREGASASSSALGSIYARYDDDNDGFLQLAELADMLKDVLPNIDDDMAHKIALGVFAKCDVNADQNLSRQECLDMLDILTQFGTQPFL